MTDDLRKQLIGIAEELVGNPRAKALQALLGHLGYRFVSKFSDGSGPHTLVHNDEFDYDTWKLMREKVKELVEEIRP